jgi:hypothetical protein
MAMTQSPMYLGNAVYLTADHDGELVLTTDSHKLDEAGNIIFVNKEVAIALHCALNDYLLQDLQS